MKGGSSYLYYTKYTNSIIYIVLVLYIIHCTDRDVILYIIVSYIRALAFSSWESGDWGLTDNMDGGVDSWWCGKSSILAYTVASWS